jgi:predicted transcriptional regulator of viral defense system
MRGAQPPDGPHVWHAAGLAFRYVVVVPQHFDLGLEMIWPDERFRVPITDRERTLLDLFAMPRLFGGVGEGMRVLEQFREGIDLAKLVAYALRYGSVAVAKRLGWTLEATGARPAVLAPLRELGTSSYSALDPGRIRRGRYDRGWMIIDNRAEDQV